MMTREDLSAKDAEEYLNDHKSGEDALLKIRVRFPRNTVYM